MEAVNIRKVTVWYMKSVAKSDMISISVILDRSHGQRIFVTECESKFKCRIVPKKTSRCDDEGNRLHMKLKLVLLK